MIWTSLSILNARITLMLRCLVEQISIARKWTLVGGQLTELSYTNKHL